MEDDVEETTRAENVALDTFGDGKRHWTVYLINTAYPITIFSGVVLNILAFVILIRGRLWRKHEGYLYLATILSTNVGVLLFSTSSFWLPSVYVPLSYYPPDTSQVMCKLWTFLKSIFFASGWLSVALLLTCYLRAGMIRIERCPVFAAKYCTLFASKVVVGVVFGCLFVLGLPYLVIYDLEDGAYCMSRPYIASVVSRLVETILMFAVPFLFFLVVLLMPLCTSKKGSSGPVGSAQSEETVADKQMRKMAIIISSMILLSQLIVVLARAVFRNVKGYTPIVEIVHGLTLSIHPVLCFTILTMFRQGARSCCRCLCPSVGREEGEQMIPPSTPLKDAPK